MKILVIQNQKGGVSKTTTAIHLAQGLTLLRREKGIKPGSKGNRVLLCDFDQQGSVKQYFRVKYGEHDISDFLVNGVDYRSVVQKITPNHAEFGFDAMLSSRSIADAEFRLQTFPRREETLSLRIEEQDLDKFYDLMIIDCPPTLNLLTYNALRSSDFVLIPSAMDFLSFMGIEAVLRNIENVKKYFKKDPKVLGILPTGVDQRTKVASDITSGIKATYPKIPLLDPIRLDTKVKQAQIKKQTLFEYSPQARASEDYWKLVKKVESVLTKEKEDSLPNLQSIIDSKRLSKSQEARA